MGYALDLDEVSEVELRNELGRRQAAQEKGLCDYCGRPAGTLPTCRFPTRHNAHNLPIRTMAGSGT